MYLYVLYIIFLYLLVLSCNVPSCTCLGILVLPCTILYRLVPIREILYLLVLSCTKPTISCTCWYRLVPSCTNLGNLVLAGTVLFQTKKSGTALYHLVLACTNRGILVLAGTGTDWYVPVQTSTFQFACLRSGVQDSRCTIFLNIVGHDIVCTTYRDRDDVVGRTS